MHCQNVIQIKFSSLEMIKTENAKNNKIYDLSKLFRYFLINSVVLVQFICFYQYSINTIFNLHLSFVFCSFFQSLKKNDRKNRGIRSNFSWEQYTKNFIIYCTQAPQFNLYFQTYNFMCKLRRSFRSSSKNVTFTLHFSEHEGI